MIFLNFVDEIKPLIPEANRSFLAGPHLSIVIGPESENKVQVLKIYTLILNPESIGNLQ